MRTKPTDAVESCRITRGDWKSTPADGCNGAFLVPYKGATLRIIASDGAHWDHVSVSCADRCPTWEEMSWVKNQFFRADETVLQFHPRRGRHVNHHPYCLHLWRYQNADPLMPPLWMIAPT